MNRRGRWSARIQTAREESPPEDWLCIQGRQLQGRDVRSSLSFFHDRQEKIIRAEYTRGDMLSVTKEFRDRYPGARMGMLAVERVINPPSHADLDKDKAGLENQLRSLYSTAQREDLVRLPSVQPYVTYYRRFKKTYHVLLQLESVVFREKPLPRVAALVEAMFMAELKNHLLTAGHDLDILQGPLTLDAAKGSEQYLLIGGQEVKLKENDMMVRDAEGVISSVLYGPDFRTRIREGTKRACFTVYAPEGISASSLASHLDDLEANIRIISPRAGILKKAIYP
jgi:DNA/RNA-binding domain of Phe-tRNA-synthetase-like protein